MDRAFYTAHRGASLILAGDAAGTAELLKAVREADAALTAAGEPTGIHFDDAAAVYALAAGGTADPAADRYAARAVQRLRQAARVGYLGDPAQVRTMREADEYAALRGRADYRDLLRTLPGGLDPAPPPRERKP